MSDKPTGKSTISEAGRVLGKKGGATKSPARARASRANGKESGGRPKGSKNK